ncbi:penicillin-binding transpeptidase domain-containing protein [Streptomyces mesophilus]|uniref:penicillin-binding transpeptidase domain-containing protein n=1 Tax=Streptomyces mesophilus TaxID=1775132 RepID=UPI0033285B5A
MTGEEVTETVGKFFKAWAKGDADAAANLTNNNAAASKVFGSFAAADLTKVKIDQGKVSGTSVPFTVSATVSYEGKSKPLSYKSELKVVRGKTTGAALIDWQPAVVHPDLKEGDTFAVGQADDPQVEVVDRDDKVLTAEKYPSLKPVIDELLNRYADKAGGKPGLELWIERADASAYNTPLVTLQKGEPGKLKTRLSATAQAAAEKAVKLRPESSVVAVQPSSGDVLAVANNRADGFNAAFSGTMAPGSTMKIVTAAMLIDYGVVSSAHGPAPCTPDAMFRGRTIKNLPGLQPDKGATLAETFSRSCNTGFIKHIDDDKLSDSSLTDEAAKFGIGLEWQTGIPSYDGSVPADYNERATNAIGQGTVQMSPLNMASIVATVKNGGTFLQPSLVPGSYGIKRAHAPGISSHAAQQVATMMNITATSGTAKDVMAQAGRGYKGAKTGSAEVDGQGKPNSWFAGFREDMAVAAVTQEGGRGGESAGPIVATVLRAGS